MYDYVIVTHIPAFYKVNLYNELSKKLKILVLFIAENTEEKRADDFITLEKANFTYEVLGRGDFQSRDIKANIKKLKIILKSIEYKRLLVSGWDLQEFWYLVMFYPKVKNILALESTVLESSTKGIKGWIKKFFLSRIAMVFASGNLHVELLKALDFNGIVKITKGVGIANEPIYNTATKEYQKKFLYIGRLSKVKNLEMLVNVFNDIPEYYLTIVGDGEEKNFLQTFAKSNITFLPPVCNSNIHEVFLNHDVFVLPSLSEPWGLVVEEALYFGLPVIVSQNCGSVELIEEGKNGYIFNPLNSYSLRRSIESMNGHIFNEMVEYLKLSHNNRNTVIQKVEPYVI